MIVDGHVHLLPPRVVERAESVGQADPWFAACHRACQRVATPESLLTRMDRYGVDRAVCFTWPFRDPVLCAEANDYLAAVQRQHPDRIVGFGVINPAASDGPLEVARCARAGLHGIGEVNADAQGWDLTDRATLAPAVDASVRAGLPWTVHCSEPVGHDYAGKGTAWPQSVARFASDHPALDVIAAHLGGGLPLYAHMPEVATLCRRLWFDTAAVALLYRPSIYRAVVDVIGSDRVVWGTDHPLLGLSRCLDEVRGAGLDPSDVDAILGGNATRLLRL